MCRKAGQGRVHVFDVENHAGTPVYVHAKVCVVDDIWASVGSDNFNRRSWTHDSELSSAVLDTTRDPREPRDPAGTGEGARTFARDLRLRLAREHLDLRRRRQRGRRRCSTRRASSTRSAERAAALDAWHEDGRRGPRPPDGCARTARAAAVPHAVVGHPGLPPARRPRRPAAADAAEEDLLSPRTAARRPRPSASCALLPCGAELEAVPGTPRRQCALPARVGRARPSTDDLA